MNKSLYGKIWYAWRNREDITIDWPTWLAQNGMTGPSHAFEIIDERLYIMAVLKYESVYG